MPEESEQRQLHALDELKTRLHEKALEAAGRAQGTAALAEQNALRAIERVVVLEDHDRETRGDLKEIKADIAGIKQTLTAMNARSPIQQGLYALTALAVLGYFTLLLWDRLHGAGAG